ncbi:ABC transporter ATP-binding protein [Faecalispora anaeroviscerum]|uniref:ABC transporter ATP-binding protein n=1 Tax=Faecalispora anaeroviscerum TaxID=2991836 RepID=UPI0024BB784A|nr:ABC transporter ATP-binding protein [Faecalispora anaeroviscerum]
MQTAVPVTEVTAKRPHQGLEIQNVSKLFQSVNGPVKALDGINLHVRSKEFLTLLGTSGCGKSTLLRIIGGLETASSGSITYQQQELKAAGPDRGMVFQNYTLFPWLTVLENIEFGLKQKNIPAKERREIAEKYVDLVALRGFESLYPKSLSGGMKQRVAIARALANDPDILLLDEPFGALDMQTRELMQELLLNVWQRSPKTIIMVTHDIDEAILLADRVVVMSARPGRVREIIDVGLERPRDHRTRLTQEFLRYKERASELIREESLRLMNAI